MSGNGLDFPISIKYLDDNSDDDSDEEKSITSKHRYSSTASLNRISSVPSQWSSVTQLHEKPSITPLMPLKTKPSTNTIGNRSVNTMPNTPGSILTFSSNNTTLVDYQHPLPAHHYSPKSPTKSDNEHFLYSSSY